MRKTIDVKAILMAAGWRPGRKRDVEVWRRELAQHDFSMSAPVSQFLEEFGGIAIGLRGSGVRTAREPFAIDPMLGAWLGEFIRGFESETIGPLCPVGEVGAGGEGTLVAAEDGEILILAEDGDGEVIAAIGYGYDALANLIVGDY